MKKVVRSFVRKSSQVRLNICDGRDSRPGRPVQGQLIYRSASRSRATRSPGEPLAEHPWDDVCGPVLGSGGEVPTLEASPLPLIFLHPPRRLFASRYSLSVPRTSLCSGRTNLLSCARLSLSLPLSSANPIPLSLVSRASFIRSGAYLQLLPLSPPSPHSTRRRCSGIRDSRSCLFLLAIDGKKDKAL